MTDSESEPRQRASGHLAEDELDQRDPDMQNVDTEEERDAREAQRRRPRARGDDEGDEEEEELRYGAQHVIKLFVPVSLCMLVVVLTIVSINCYTDQSGGVYLIYAPFQQEATDTASDTIKDTVLNALIFLAVIVVMTTLLVLLYKYKFYKVIHGWLIVTSLILLFVLSFIYLEAFFKAYNLAFDFLTLSIFIWNFGAMGMLSMHWKAPLRVLQAYHIVISALLALKFIKYLPEWTLWLILAVIALWDLVAVLCPHGPLRMLVNIAQERNENIFPALIYTSTVAYTVGMADNTTDVSDDSQEGIPRLPTGETTPASTVSTNAASAESTASRPLKESSGWTNRNKRNYGSDDIEEERPGRGMRGADAEERGQDEEGGGDNSRPQLQQQLEDQEDEEKGVKLGLGDFIFYSILVGKASSSGDWATTLAAYVAILMGLCFTLVLLAIGYKKALPALPISIAFGLAFNFGTQYLISPFITALAAHQVFI